MPNIHWEQLRWFFNSPSLRRHFLLTFSILVLMTGASSRLAIAIEQERREQDLWEDEQPGVRLAPGREGARHLRLDALAMRQLLEQAPLEALRAADDRQAELPLPMPDGSMVRFRLAESPVMEAALAARYPEIRTYNGHSIDDPMVTMRCDLTPQGFHATVIQSEHSVVSIHPVAGTDRRASRYVSYFGTTNGDGDDPLVCDFRDPDAATGGPPFDRQELDLSALSYQSGEILRVYRIAISATWEYCNTFGGGTTAGTVASLITWLNGVNAIYERELTIRLQMVDAPTIIYSNERGFNAANDPFTNGNTGSMLSQLGQVMASIPVSSFDVGHVLGTGGGGVAYLGVVCRESTISGGPVKGLGVSSVSGSLGNSGGLYVLSHELGHQFGAYHTFNGTAGNCGGANRTGNSAFEPGSGMTIMSYAGGCGTDNIVAPGGGNMRFHVGSLRQIFAHLGGIGRCFVGANTSNSAPTISAGSDYTIPLATPFELRATASDPNADDLPNLTYTWEQVDAGMTYSNPPYTDSGDPTTTTRPIFRSYPPVSSPSRFFPSLNYILNNANVPPEMINGLRSGESLPAVGRIINFGVAVRDNRPGGGGVAEDGVRLTVAGNAGPFRVTAPNTAVSWSGGSTQTVTWLVNNTNTSPVSCAFVRISLSTDGGQTFPVILNASTANDGTESVILPSGVATTQARIKIEAVGNIFFDISDTGFTITSSGTVSLPTLTGYTFNPVAPVADTKFSGTLTGTNFISAGTQVWFCTDGTSSCNLLPAASVSVTSSTSLTLSGIALPAGRWQAYVQTAAGVSNRSASFTVAAPAGTAPVITSYVWTPATPIAGEQFDGTINGSNFCAGGSTACTEFDSTRINVVSSTTLRISGAVLTAGSWQFYLQSQAGPSNRSTSFTVTSPSQSVPVITGYTLTPTSPVAGSPFNVVVTGSNFIPGATQINFCLVASTICTVTPTASVSVTSTTSLTLTNFTLNAGSWQFYLQTSSGISTRSSPFTVQSSSSSVPQISSYTFNPVIPITGRPFSATITGDNFDLSGTRIFFCQIGRPFCVRLAGVVINVNSRTEMQLENVVLTTGTWQFYLQTAAGNSTRSTTFTVQVTVLGPPTISGFSFNPVDPQPDQPFNLTVVGSGFIASATRVFLCPEGPEDAENCTELRQSLISVPTQALLVAEQLSLGPGRWQIKVQTPAGISPRSSAFTLQSGQTPIPRITTIVRNPPTTIAGQPFTLTLNGEGFIPGATRLFTCLVGSINCSEVAATQVSATSATIVVANRVTLTAGTWQVYVQTVNGASTRSAGFTVVPPQPSPPTIVSFTLDTDAPLANQPMQINLVGTGFVNGATRVFICLTGRSICTEVPAASVTVNGPTSLRASDVRLPAGDWQMMVQTSAGISERSASFTVNQSTAALPALTSFSFDPPTPESSSPFSGRLTGTNFVRDGSTVFFCVENGSCIQAPTSSVNVVDQNTIDLTAISLPVGKWQLYVRTAAGDSNRSTTFEVVARPGSFPSISSYIITPTVPRANVNFSGTINGTNFEATTTKVFFCQSGTNKCQLVSPLNVTVKGANSLTFSNVKLPRASWQLYIQTSVAWSDRSRPFLVL
jgi:hypothetical protein